MWRTRLAVLFFALITVFALARCTETAEVVDDLMDAINGPAATARPAPVTAEISEIQPTPTLAPVVTRRATAAAATQEPASQPQAASTVTEEPASQPEPAATATARRISPTAAVNAPFSGVFVGLLSGDGESHAPLVLELEQQGRVVAGIASLGDGITINAGGFCGRFAVPASSFEALEELETADSRELQTTTSVEVDGFIIPVDLTVSLSPDGKTMTAEATLQTPALCANDPTLSGTLNRRSGGG